MIAGVIDVSRQEHLIGVVDLINTVQGDELLVKALDKSASLVGSTLHQLLPEVIGDCQAMLVDFSIAPELKLAGARWMGKPAWDRLG